MGIYDRDYYRREGPSYLDSLALRGQATKWLLIATSLVFILQLITRVPLPQGWEPGELTKALMLDPKLVLSGEIWRLLTYAFLHDEETWTHIFFNMWFLWLFGGYVEDLYGRWEFLVFYLTAAVVGGLAFVAEFAILGKAGVCVGASGAVTAVMVLCAFYHPRLTILLFFVLPVPIWALAIFQVIKDALGFLGGGNQATAFSVHLGGAALAAGYFQSQFRILNLFDFVRAWKKRRARPRLRVYHPVEEEPEPVAVAGPHIDEQFEAKVDAVLEKVARSGKDSLTESEKQVLLKASELYKRRRL